MDVGTEIGALLDQQAGVVSRRQVLACGLDDAFIERQLRSRRWRRVHRGVYARHTGPLSWSERAWAAVLFHGDAALHGRSAALAAGVGTPAAGEPVHVAVDQRRRVVGPPGVTLHRVTGLAGLVHPTRRPPSIRLEVAVLHQASEARSEVEALAVLADACQSRRTTPERLAAALATLPCLPGRRLLRGVLDDVAAGAYSVLEHRYLVRVERPHGLPTGRRQRRVRPGRRPFYRDVDYLDGALVVELDGRLGHTDTLDRWADLERDVATAVAGSVTLRLGWRQVLEPCRTAAAVGRLLAARGWTGRLTPCGPGCTAVGSAVA